MFCKTSDGAYVTGKLFSIIQTARANGLKTELYIKYVIDNIARKDINTLLPWSGNIKKKFMIQQTPGNSRHLPGNFGLIPV